MNAYQQTGDNDSPFIEEISPYVRCVGEYAAVPHTRIQARILYDHLLEYINEGKGQYIVNDKVYQVSSGDVILIPPCSVLSLMADEKDPYIRQCVHFDFKYMGGYTSMPLFEWFPGKLKKDKIHLAPSFAQRLKLPVVSHLKDTPRIHSLFCRLFKEMYHKKPGYELAAKVCMLDILLTVHRHSLAGNVESSDSTVDVLPHGMVHAKNYMEKNFNEKLTLHELADISHYHPVHLERLFKQYIGCSPIEYLMEVRVSKAKEFLKHSELNITQIAGMTGFDSIQYFSRVFKKFVQLSPNQYRKKIHTSPGDEMDISGNIRDYPTHEAFLHVASRLP
jgi:AraC-like DNA-binding protein